MEGFGRIPIWQRLLLFLLVAGVIVGGWYFFFYVDAVDGRANAEAALTAAQTELAEVKTKRDNFDAEKRKIEAAEAALEEQREVLPLTASTVDNLMQTFQQQSRLVGMTVESWTNEPEEFQDFYARMPIKVRATGTWTQVGEFFRRVSELKRIVSVDRLSLQAGKDKRTPGSKEAAERAPLEIEFEAATYRFLTDEERNAAAEKGAAKKGRRKK
ncbi:MAG: type 4a pilus biogenesis protein PilO [Deltaproteobacteria bacterium]|nr:type 4a pilus biogenesis protein PilO [Deltaproteobacteria bacterium]MBK8239057.1 type 4a pilus biogenesis protein PilO [Deltaproteobacteria bacterium]MBK8717567.1 type 4a pilus biogenesis protein PilO [Deltaproteobacteria bacterium]MBP7285825.1 type 4a pilus biogenesis protein PilO [Nannocystaceae bacterium]